MSTESPLWQGTAGAGKDALVQDLKNVVGDAEAMIKQLANASAEEYSALSSKVDARLNEARNRLEVAGNQVIESARDAADATQKYVKENPWKSVAIAAAGVLIGLLVHRSR